MSRAQREPLENILPPLIFGTATFNTQYNRDPYALDSVGLVRSALEFGIRAFDTSPYYGPSEEILSAALHHESIAQKWPRESYHILTKVGRIASDEFDYSPAWIRQSIARSLKRLKTTHLDVVYCHDVEYVSAEEVVEAVKELRRIRDEEGSIKYVGISGYPLDVLCSLAERILMETGEPLDIVQNYALFTVQNTTLASYAIDRFLDAGVKVVPNASPLGMGFLRTAGPFTEVADWHPSPKELRAVVKKASDFCNEYGELLEVVAIRYALEHWREAGSSVGTYGDPASGAPWDAKKTNAKLGGKKQGVNVIGVSNAAELNKTMAVWYSVLDATEHGQDIAVAAGRWHNSHKWGVARRRGLELLAEHVKEILGDWYNYSWSSPPPGFVNARKR